jgi:imidazoleglycerol-phosphate dehydratase
MRKSRLRRKTRETSVSVALNLDGSGKAEIATGIAFLDHMLSLVAKHSLADLVVRGRGDVEVDFHHLVEDVGLSLGEGLREALADKRGVRRYGWAAVPMDEALVLAAVDLSGRPFLAYGLRFPARKIGEFEVELIEEFFRALANAGALTLHLVQLAGRNSHHIAEAGFKAFARALGEAVRRQAGARGVPSTKGRL